MASKERQRRYRAKRRKEGDERLSVWVSSDAANSLREVVSGLSITQGQLIAKLLLSLGEKFNESSS